MFVCMIPFQRAPLPAFQCHSFCRPPPARLCALAVLINSCLRCCNLTQQMLKSKHALISRETFSHRCVCETDFSITHHLDMALFIGGLSLGLVLYSPFIYNRFGAFRCTSISHYLKEISYFAVLLPIKSNVWLIRLLFLYFHHNYPRSTTRHYKKQEGHVVSRRNQSTENPIYFFHYSCGQYCIA